jgi:hypothetical protein
MTRSSRRAREQPIAKIRSVCLYALISQESRGGSERAITVQPFLQ